MIIIYEIFLHCYDEIIGVVNLTKETIMKADNKIPNDLKKFARSYVVKRVVACIVMLALLAVFLVLWIDIIFPSSLSSIKALFAIAVLSLPFVITGVPFKLFDKTYFGTVESVAVDTTVDSDAKAKPTRETLYVKNTVYLSIRTTDGKTIDRKAYSSQASKKQSYDMYKKGDKVFHLYGSKHTIILPIKSDSYVKCAVCGDLNETNNDKCRNCGHTLIK